MFFPMKKIILLLLLLPFVGFSQTVDLVKWAGPTDLKPTLLNDYISAENFSGSGITGPTASYNGFLGSSWPTANSRDNNKYFQIAINQTLDGSFNLQQINFEYQGNARAYEVRYSMNANFSNPVSLGINSSADFNNTPRSGNLTGLNIPVIGGQTIYIRFYAYNGGGTWNIMNGITLRGTVTAPGRLMGDYIVGSASNAKFNTLTAAVRALNALGVRGNTNLILDNTTYNRASNEIFPIVFNSYTGNENYTVTVKPNTGRTVTVEASNDNWNFIPPAVFKLNGTDNVIFDGSNNGTDSKNLTIYNNNTVNPKRSVIWIASDGNNGANNNTVKNVILRQFTKEASPAYGVYSGGTGSLDDASNAGNSSNTVNNVTFTKVGQAVYVNSGSNLSSNWRIQNNTIGGTTDDDKPFVGVYLNNASNYEISGNSIVGVLRNNSSTPSPHSGIMVEGASSGTISKNLISDVSNTNAGNYHCAGIYLNSGNNLVTNNYVTNIKGIRTGDNSDNFLYAGQGIYLKSGSNNKIYFNTVLMNSTGTNNVASAALYIEAGTNIAVRNNIFYNQQSGRQYAINCGVNINQVDSDYNDLVSSTIGYYASNRININGWRTGTGKDSNSLNKTPIFIGSTLKLDPNNTDNKTLIGLQVSPAVNQDYYNAARTKPIMGAEEMEICAPDGDKTTFGNGQWIGYVYSNYTNYATTPAINNANYQGYVTEPIIFERNIANGSPFRGDYTNLCSAPVTNYFVRYKMKMTLAAGDYNFTVGGDDGYRLKIDGVAVASINNWNEHGYATNSVTRTMTEGEHTFEIEYFNGPNLARVSFTYNKRDGDPTLFGDNVWNVYGYNVEDINVDPSSASYYGWFVDPSLGINSEDRWNKALAPSTAVATATPGTTAWAGTALGNNNFTVVHKRKGFPCGLYQIKMDKWDDAVQVYLDGNLIFEGTGYNGNANEIVHPELPGYYLNADSKMEVRLREGGGDAYVKMTLTDKPSIFNGTWSATPDNTSVKIESDFVLNSNLNVCSCTVKAGKKLTIEPNAALNVMENVVVEATGTILVKNTGSLVQIKDNATFTGNADSFTMERNTTPMIIYDYTYWSSPVASQKLVTFSPLTLSDKYYSYNGTNWFIENRDNTMTAGRGYIIRAPQGWNGNITHGGTSQNETHANGSFAPGVFKGVFKGKANAGNITVPLLGNMGSTNLLGNPYPSPISTDEFMAANPNKIDGTFYFWTHKTRVSTVPNANGTYSYSNQDYSVYNKTGGIATTPLGDKPNGNINSGQGFFVRTAGTGNVVFKNSMRIQGISRNSNFYRTANTSERNAENDSKYWLSIANADGLYSEFLVGYIDGATNNLDSNYDGITYSSGNVMLYTIVDANKLAIQGRQYPFNNTDIVPFAYKVATAGQYTISINKKEGEFETGQTIYLFDTTTNQYHDLTAGDFTFTSAAGTFENRFEVRYTNETLGVENPIASNSDIVVYKNGNQIAVKATNFTIADMQVYDITGKLLFNKKGIDNNEFSTSSLNVATQVVVVKVTLDGGQTISKKVIMN